MIRIIALLILAAQLWGADGPRIFYSREQAGSTPAYVQVVVNRNGTAVYRESADDPDEVPLEFRYRPDEVDEIFHLADRLDHFRKPLESNLKVANMGLKTLRYEGDGENNEQQFNFSKSADARVLADWFARTAETARHVFNLERAIQFDKLGINDALLQLQITIEKNRLVAGDQFLPLLDKIAADETVLNMARTRAASLAQEIRSSGGKK